MDDGDESAGFKFNKWEIQGIPLRIEIGPRDIDDKKIVVVRRDISEKINLLEKNISKKFFENMMEDIQKNLFENSKKLNKDCEIFCDNIKDFEKNVKLKKKILVPWFDDEESERKIKEKYSYKTSCIPIRYNKKIFEKYDIKEKFIDKKIEKYNCFFDEKKKANCFVYFCRSY